MLGEVLYKYLYFRSYPIICINSLFVCCILKYEINMCNTVRCRLTGAPVIPGTRNSQKKKRASFWIRRRRRARPRHASREQLISRYPGPGVVSACVTLVAAVVFYRRNPKVHANYRDLVQFFSPVSATSIDQSH